VITPYRNGEDPYAAGQHRGIDIAGSVGAAVAAAAAGEVRFAGVAGSSGLTVSVRTADGFDTSYLHLGAVEVSAGERVSAGQRLGAVGTSGVRSAAAPHLHFGVREAASRHAYRDPLTFLPPPGASAPEPPAGTPVPEPAPDAPVVAPAPRGVPGPGRQPVRRPLPGARRLPLRRPVPGVRRVPARPPTPADRRAPARRRVPAPAPLVSAAPSGRRVAAPEPDRARAGRPATLDSHREPEPLGRRALGEPPGDLERPPGSARSDAPPRARAPVGTADGGPDVGWALACAGVLLAAGILALGGDGRGEHRGARGGARRVGRHRAARLAAERLGAAIRPLLGRR
jgi:Peptidase family M23